LYLKIENLQTTGSFKLRGAYYKISNLSDEARSRGVVACSAGNHAQGVALAALKNNIKSIICLPSCAPKFKINATRAYGAEVVLVDGVYDEAYNYALSLQNKLGYNLIHPFDDEDVIAGQGTIALEILKQIYDFDSVVVPIGGGGLASGIAFTIKQINPRIKIYGVQASGAPSMLNSIVERRIAELPSVSTIADGIAVKKPGRLTYELCYRYVDDIVTVTDEEICAAIVTLLERCKLLTEGAGAASLAAVMFDKLNLIGKKTVCLISGGNIDLETLTKIIKTKEK
jgi:threonine dehydratase